MDKGISPSLATKGPIRHQALDSDARVRISLGDCLPVRYANQECGLCASACPAGAIALDQGRPALRGACLGCGQCAAVCPTAALETDGFALPATLPQGGKEISVDCWRVAFEDSPASALRVPCLGGLSVGWLLSLCDLASERAIHLLDRGACSKCSAGTGYESLLQRVAEARTLLLQSGVAIENLPVITHVPAHKPLAQGIPVTMGELRTDRRGFLRGLIGSAARGADEFSSLARGAEQPIVLREQAAPLEQMRVATALQRIAARHGRAVPPQALPQISLTACSAHGVCAKVCPTGALQRRDADGAVELHFHAARCVSCAQCVRVCPDQAIRVQPSGGTAVVEVLARWEAVSCSSCNEVFYGGNCDTCPACQKSQQMFQGMAALMRAPA